MSTSFLPYDATDGSLQATFPESPQSEKMHLVPSWKVDDDGGDNHDGDDYNSEGSDDYRNIVCDVDDGDTSGI